MRIKTLLMVLVTTFLTNAALCDRVNIIAENDVVFDQDNDMTHGTRIEYVRDSGWRFGAQQQIYTPDDITLRDQVPGRHPYAGALMGFVGYRDNYLTKGPVSLYNDYELLLGVLGPSALGKETQRTIHKWLDCHMPEGWDHQLHDEAIVQGQYFHGIDWRVVGEDKGWSAHLEQDAGVLLGTYQIAAGGSLTLKAGYGFGSGESDHEMYVRSAVRHPFSSVYVLGGCEGRWWLRNELLDGNAHYVHNHDTLTVDKEPLTGCLKAGVGLCIGGVEVLAVWMWWSREYKTQESPADYGMVRLGVDF